ncbi:hypothetical protein AGLY_010553 [Aphis glycines]|uniref:Uncharacterized protein n=1 Tax=Aphis glycines TaxID=307491 RepID=A0A6G0TG24_APHGL|nr:hypothetical protein AGLY_010553 [Aphis glycines]
MLPRSARAPRRPTNQRRRCHCRRSSYTFAAHARTAAARLPSLRRHQLAIVSLRNRPKARQRRRFVRTSRTRLLVSAGFRRKTLYTEYSKYNILVRDYHRPSSVRRVFVFFRLLFDSRLVCFYNFGALILIGPVFVLSSCSASCVTCLVRRTYICLYHQLNSDTLTVHGCAISLCPLRPD